MPDRNQYISHKLDFFSIPNTFYDFFQNHFRRYHTYHYKDTATLIFENENEEHY